MWNYTYIYIGNWIFRALYIDIPNYTDQSGATLVIRWQDPDADPAAQEQLDVEDLDDEPIILKDA